MGKSLAESVMLASLSIKQWSNSKKDKDASQELAESKNAERSMCSVSKHLVTPDDTRDIRRSANAARTYYYEHTLPWIRNGQDLLPAESFIDIRNELIGRKREFEQAVTEFTGKLQERIDNAKLLLGALFNPLDYPDVNAVKQAYSFEFSVTQLPDSRDIRLSLSDNDREEMQKVFQQQEEQAVQSAKRETWKRLYEVVSRIAEDLPKFKPDGKGKERGTFRDSIIENAVSLCKILETLNVTNDESLESARKEIESRLTGKSAQELRDDEGVRESTAVAAADILETIGAYYTPEKEIETTGKQ